jgi:hypothetical protein
MENWKRTLIAGAAGASLVSFFRGRKTAGLILGGIAVATLASEYPEEFADFKENLPYYIDKGTTYLDMAMRAGRHLAENSGGHSTEWLEALLHR